MFFCFFFTLLMYAMSRLMENVEADSAIVDDLVGEITNDPNEPRTIFDVPIQVTDNHINEVESSMATENIDCSFSPADRMFDNDDDVNTRYQEKLCLCSELQKILVSKVKESFVDTANTFGKKWTNTDDD